MSIIGHKGWRFIVYVVPFWNIAGARGCIWMVSRRKGTLVGCLSFLLAATIRLANILTTALLTTASIANYPGRHPLALLHSLHPRTLHPITNRSSLV
ncbi:hypothetical protein K443DRAFT_383319 [Laccaria amethystina LaAM-08-1]|uniref:Uncharacterized protein n=1 Tax=Laccaria amethystina LaAM-08-1 TaxID=1095629 RepID=A0A0C9X7P1_9AGAR|nr:hypothetical protein K443DRAFT_383319 [Laccaria amethystina LaAM-08-1]